MRLAHSLAGFRNELDKIADVVSEETQLESYGPQSPTFAAAPAPAPTSGRPWWRTPAAAAGGAAVAAGGLVASRPALRAHLMADLRGIGHGGGHAVDRARALPPQALEHAKQIAAHLKAQGIDPAQARIGISATGGTGKSTLAKALSQELGMNVLHLDDAGKSLSGRDLTKYVKNNPIAAGTIAEQTHLMNQVDPDKFDALIHLEKPMDQIKAQILARGRGAAQLEGYDYDKLHKSIQTAFHNTMGEAREVVPGMRVKVRPQDGWQSEALLDTNLRLRGIDPNGMSRQRKVISLAQEAPERMPGVLPYMRMGRIGAGVGVVGAGGALGGAAANLNAEDEAPPPTVAYAR